MSSGSTTVAPMGTGTTDRPTPRSSSSIQNTSRSLLSATINTPREPGMLTTPEASRGKPLKGIGAGAWAAQSAAAPTARVQTATRPAEKSDGFFTNRTLCQPGEDQLRTLWLPGTAEKNAARGDRWHPLPGDNAR